ncbi:hypothetical protein Tco_0163632 [Tanacetum coccineum]
MRSMRLDLMELEHHVLVYVSKPDYPEYLAPSDDDIPVEDQPLSPGYITDYDPEEDEEDPGEDLADYPTDGRDNDDDDESSGDDDDDDDVEEDEEEEEVARLLALPTPPPSTLTPLSSPPTSPTYAEVTLAAMAQMRAATPSTYHSLLPARTPPLLPIPLPAPSTSRRADIPEADMTLRKRLLLTAPTPRYEVWESSATAATRQSRSIVARKVDYSFMDTIDASIRYAKRRTMVALEVVNLRVSYQENVRKRESLEFYLRHQEAQENRAAARAEIGILRRERLAYEQESSETRQALARMPLKRTAATTTTTAMTNAQLKALIARGVANALAEIEANRTNRNGDDSHDFGTGSRRTERAACECNYSDLLKCQPLNFKGTEGVVGLTQWFKKMESVFHISNCTTACQIKFSTCTLQRKALTWWNSHVKTVGHDDVFSEEFDVIEKYVGGLPDMIHESVMASKPKTMQDAIEFATELMDQKIRTLAKRQA